MSVVNDFEERLKELNNRIDEIMSSDRSVRVKLIRVRHIRHGIEDLITELDAVTGKEIKKICQL
jgi:hypothetical protein